MRTATTLGSDRTVRGGPGRHRAADASGIGPLTFVAARPSWRFLYASKLLNGTVFPPKQVFARVTGFERQTFTTMEAQRVLTRLGFVCRRAERGEWVAVIDRPDDNPSVGDRLRSLEDALAMAQAAIAGLHARLTLLEPSR